MEAGDIESTTAIPSTPNFQSIEDFIKEHDELDALKASGTVTHVEAHSAKKQRKATLQAERERLESEKKQKRAALEDEKKSIEIQANKAIDEIGVENWVGILLEYRNAHPTTTGGLIYSEQTVAQSPPRFTSTVLIHESSQLFGGTISFSNKKDAKRHASKKAVDWLIENKYMPADGSVKFPKVPPPPVIKSIGSIQATIAAPRANPKPATSYAGQVPELCVRLGFNMPTYEITKHKETTTFWDGFAHFSGDPRIEGKLGEVKNVFGKGNAKEQVAMEVLSFLKDIERQRLEMQDVDEEEERKRKRSSVSPDIGETSGKVIKVEA